MPGLDPGITSKAQWLAHPARLETVFRGRGRTMQAALCVMRRPAIDGPPIHCCYQPNHNNNLGPET
jgi:hypothetical protein